MLKKAILANTSGENTGDQDLSGYELLSNKKTNLTDNSDVFYPTQKAVNTALDSKIDKTAIKASIRKFPNICYVAKRLLTDELNLNNNQVEFLKTQNILSSDQGIVRYFSLP